MDQSSFQKIEIFISGRSLRDKDVFSKSDPFVIVKILQNGHWRTIGQTETINNNLNPNFTKSFQIDYIFEMKQSIQFEVRDDDGSSSDFLGQAETTVGNLFGARNQTSILELGKGNGKLIIRCDKVSDDNKIFLMKWAGVKLMNTDGWFGKSDPLLKFLRERDDGTYVQVYETEVVMNNLNPMWKPFEIKASRLATSNDKKIKIECWDWEKSGQYQFIGQTFTTLTGLGQTKDFVLQNPKKKSPGTLRLDSFQEVIRPSFMDYIRGGLQLNLVIAVDFTGSNGNPNNPGSLHYRNPAGYNQYQSAIQSVGEILLAYDYDKLVPCYGFGAQCNYPQMKSRDTLHCFPLSGDVNRAEAFGLEQIMGLYNYALSNVALSGPTYFGPLIQETMKIAQQQKQSQQEGYTVLLILTDGEIHDMEPTKEMIVNSAFLPLSIIIVGVGDADFKNMEVLDGDEGLYAKGKKAQRDLVQFVPYRNFKGDQISLARHVLAEIPDQIVKYMMMMGKQPRPPAQVDINNMGYSQSMQPQQPGYPTQQSGGPPQQQGYPPQQPGYPPQQPGYPPQQSGYPSQQSGYPPQQQQQSNSPQLYPSLPNQQLGNLPQQDNQQPGPQQGFPPQMGQGPQYGNQQQGYPPQQMQQSYQQQQLYGQTQGGIYGSQQQQQYQNQQNQQQPQQGQYPNIKNPMI